MGPSSLRRQFTPSLVVSLIALFVSLGGASYAAITLPRNSVGGKQLKKNSVTAVKVKDGSLLARDFKSGQLPQGARGETGAQGQPGAQGQAGPRGVSAWDAIPSGVTVTGSQGFNTDAPGASADFGYTIPLPGKAPVALANDTANFAPDTSGATPEDDPACTGTPSVPTAPPGRFCAYLDGTPVNLDLIRIVPMVSNLRDTGVRVVFDANAAGDAFLNFTWAYTAP